MESEELILKRVSPPGRVSFAEPRPCLIDIIRAPEVPRDLCGMHEYNSSVGGRAYRGEMSSRKSDLTRVQDTRKLPGGISTAAVSPESSKLRAGLNQFVYTMYQCRFSPEFLSFRQFPTHFSPGGF